MKKRDVIKRLQAENQELRDEIERTKREAAELAAEQQAEFDKTHMGYATDWIRCGHLYGSEIACQTKDYEDMMRQVELGASPVNRFEGETAVILQQQVEVLNRWNLAMSKRIRELIKAQDEADNKLSVLLDALTASTTITDITIARMRQNAGMDPLPDLKDVANRLDDSFEVLTGHKMPERGCCGSCKPKTESGWLCPEHGCPSLGTASNEAGEVIWQLCEDCNSWWRKRYASGEWIKTKDVPTCDEVLASTHNDDGEVA